MQALRASFNNSVYTTEYLIHTPPTVIQSEMGFEVRNLNIGPWDVINHRTIIRKSLDDSHVSVKRKV